MKVENENDGWLIAMPDYTVENPIQDLLNKEIDHSANLWGNLLLERGDFGTILGLSSVGKSVVGMQIAISAACGRSVFGIPFVKPLRVLLVQSEDKRNTRVKQVSGIINELGLSEEERKLVSQNLSSITPKRRCDRGQTLFDNLKKGLRGRQLDLLVLNPAFSFMEGSTLNAQAVGEFLRVQLYEFCMDVGCGALVVHHLPKPKVGKKDGGRDADMAQYDAFGSAEWANAPRMSISVKPSLVRYAWKFVIGKGGDNSGWAPDKKGEFFRYFTHSRKTSAIAGHGTVQYWGEASEADIKAAIRGGDVDFSEIFQDDTDYNLAEIRERLSIFGHKFESADDVKDLLDDLVQTGSITTDIVEGGPHDGEQTWRSVRTGVSADKFEEKKSQALGFITRAGAKGTNLTTLRDDVPYAHSVLDKVLEALIKDGTIKKTKVGKGWSFTVA